MYFFEEVKIMDEKMLMTLGLEFFEALLCMGYAIFTYATLQKKDEGRYLWRSLLNNAILVSSEAIFSMYRTLSNQVSHLFTVVSLYIIIVTQFVIFHLINRYISMRSRDYKGMRLIDGILVALFGLLITNPIHELYFHYTPNRNLVLGVMFTISIGMATLIFLWSMLKMMINYRRFQNFWWIVLMFSLALPLIGLLYELSTGYLLWFHVLNTVATISVVSGYMILNRQMLTERLTYRIHQRRRKHV